MVRESTDPLGWGKGISSMRLQKLNPGITSKINRSTVLALIHRHPLVSRSQLATLTGLDRSTITHILKDLLQEKLVEEVIAATGWEWLVGDTIDSGINPRIKT